MLPEQSLAGHIPLSSQPSSAPNPPTFPRLTSISGGGGSKSSGRSAPRVSCMMSMMWSRTDMGSRKPRMGGSGGGGGSGPP